MTSEAIFQRIKKVRVADTVVDQIISLIEDGTLEQGDQLPSERELVGQFQVARPSVREALRILEYRGIIDVQPGKGAFVLGLDTDSDEQRVKQWFQENAEEVLDILQVRSTLEVLAARLAAQRSTPEFINDLEEILENAHLVIDHDEPDELVKLDRMFHQRIGEACGNTLLTSLVEVLMDAMVNPRRSLMRLRKQAGASWADHTQIMQAIRSGDPDLAEKAMNHHIENVRNNIIALTDGKFEI
jgi:GntR family transcriptional repressor for pyruvate dehydrogenase complex